ncbi:methyltransferase [Colletotrichum sublineola]|nr:methyltransferase [Colletotrichum sublineola]
MAIDTVPRGDVRATLNFFAAPADNSTPYNVIRPEGAAGERNYGDSPTETLIHDIRGRESDFTLDHDAFAVIRNLPPSSEKDFVDDASVKKNYYPEVERLILEHVPGSNRVFFFDHIMRRAGHKAFKHPVFRPCWSCSLAYASSSTLAEEDVVPIEHRQTTGYIGETASIKFNPQQKWYYLSGMTDDERLLLEIVDSEGRRDGLASRRLAHSAFQDPRTRVDAEGRESIEVRALVFGP